MGSKLQPDAKLPGFSRGEEGQQSPLGCIHPAQAGAVAGLNAKGIGSVHKMHYR